jgi:hypothetical protein
MCRCCRTSFTPSGPGQPGPDVVAESIGRALPEYGAQPEITSDAAATTAKAMGRANVMDLPALMSEEEDEEDGHHEDREHRRGDHDRVATLG